MRIDILTLFPEMFASILGTSILKRAADPSLYSTNSPTSDPATPPAPLPPHVIKQTAGAAAPPPKVTLESSGAPVSYHLHDIRQYTDDKHSKVDKPPFGGGPGMVIQCQPVWDAVQAAQAQDPRPATRILLTPQGERLNQAIVEELAQQPRLMLLAGHYEGFDERVIEALSPMREISVGDYVLSGGELPAMVLIDAIVRLIPGVLGDLTSVHHESFSPGSEGLLDYPHYTRPREWMGREVPEVLLSGNHAAIEKWRAELSRLRTEKLRPDLLK